MGPAPRSRRIIGGNRPDGSRAIGQILPWTRRHPDLTALAILILIGGVIRLALVYRIPPLFLPGDSQSYLLPAYDLARSLGFDPIIKRPLGYPLFVAAVMVLAGEDLRALVFVQALLGLATVVVTYWIGGLASGPRA